MTTFTRVGSHEQADIAVYPNRVLSKINDNVYGGFTEHMVRGVPHVLPFVLRSLFIGSLHLRRLV